MNEKRYIWHCLVFDTQFKSHKSEMLGASLLSPLKLLMMTFTAFFSTGNLRED
jgi:hypothetical protein